jgi:hypothetical protein
VIGDGEFPGVGEEDSSDFSGSESGGDEAAGEGFDEAAIFGKSETAIAGSVSQGCLAIVPAAALEDNIVDEAAGGIGVELGAKHRGNCIGSESIVQVAGNCWIVLVPVFNGDECHCEWNMKRLILIGLSKCPKCSR